MFFWGFIGKGVRAVGHPQMSFAECTREKILILEEWNFSIFLRAISFSPHFFLIQKVQITPCNALTLIEISFQSEYPKKNAQIISDDKEAEI